MSEKYKKAGKVKKTEIVFRMVFPANDHATVVIEPGEKSLHFPAPLGAAKGSAILGLGVASPPASMGGDHFSAVLREDLLIQSIAVVSFIADDSLGRFRDKALLDCLVDQRYFSRGSTRCAKGDRKTMAVRNCHDFSAFSAL